MNKKEYLQQTFSLHDEINFKKNLLQTLKEKSTDTSANPLDTEFVRSDKVNNANAIIVENIVDLENEIFNLLHKYETISNEIKAAISVLKNDNERFILTYRYIYFYQFKKISSLLFLSEAQIFRLHRSGIEKIKI